MTDEIRINRLAGILGANPDMRFHRPDLVEKFSTPQAVITLRDITRLWPQIEATVGERHPDYYVVRPIGRLRYGVAAVTNPLPAMLAMTDREKTIITRLRNDSNSHLLARISATGGEAGHLATEQLQRIAAYLASVDAQHLDTWRLDHSALLAYLALPLGRFPAGRVYARDEHPSGTVQVA